MKSDDEVRLALEIVERIKPLLAGREPEVQGAVLAELLSLWLAGHQRETRWPLLAMHIDAVRDLAELNAVALPSPSAWPAEMPGFTQLVHFGLPDFEVPAFAYCYEGEMAGWIYGRTGPVWKALVNAKFDLEHRR